MPVPAASSQFPDLLDPRFQKIFDDTLRQLPDMVPKLFSHPPDNGREDMRWSEVGAFDNFAAFSGSVTYDSVFQGYDVTQTHLEFASGFQITRTMMDYDQFHIMDGKAKGLAEAANRTRQGHAAEIFTGAFSASSNFYNHSEGVALCSNSHTTTADGVSTASGFDNLGTAALSMTAVVAARIQMRGFRNDRGGRFSAMGDSLWFPPDLFGVAQEIMGAPGNPESPNLTINVNSAIKDGTGRMGWEYMSDANDWFLVDSREMKNNLMWVDSAPLEFAFAEDLDTIVGKWRAYMRYSLARLNWRWINGNQVS